MNDEMNDEINRRNVLKLITGLTAGLALSGSAIAVSSSKNNILNFVNPLEHLTKPLKDVLIANQRIFNESQIDPKYDYKKNYSLEVIDKFVDKMISGNIFSIQPFTKERGSIFSIGFHKLKTELILCLSSKELECKDDLSSAHHFMSSFDSEDRLLSIDTMACELAAYVDRKNIFHCLKNAGTVSTLDFNSIERNTIREISQSFYVKIVEASNIVHRKTLRGSANKIVTNPEISEFFEMHQEFRSFSSNSFEIGVQHVGTIGRFELYKDPLFPINKILLAYKGEGVKNAFDAGYFYCPHIIFNDYSQDAITVNSASGFSENGENYYAAITLENYLRQIV